jgi:MerR family transcriptional regulator, copper efflux regulator
MNIGQVSTASGVSAKMIRYYESISLIPTAGRTDAGYRVYTNVDVDALRFIHRAREFGFPIERIRVLVDLWQGSQPSREVKRVALDHVAELDRRIAELAAMRDALRELADNCHGDHRPECPILRDLEGYANSAGATERASATAGRPGKRGGGKRAEFAPLDSRPAGRL